jgi:TusA-related sulfurtransferase
MADEKTIDCRWLNCPQPVILTKDALLEMKACEVLNVTVDN